MRTSTTFGRRLHFSIRPFSSHRPAGQCGLHGGFHHEKRPLVGSHYQLGLSPGGRRGFTVHHFVDTYLQTSHDYVLQLHSALHLPWFVTIPLLALGINALVRLPFIISFQKDAQKRAALAPILTGWALRHRRDVKAERIPAAKRDVEMARRFRETQTRLDKEWGLGSHSIRQHLLGIPVWLAATETIRRMCGGPPGLVGLLGSLKSTRPPPSSGEQSAMSTAGDADISTSAGVPLPAPGPLPSDVTESVSPLFEPSFSTGGCLWFPDLTAADPYHILPFAFSAVVVYNLLPSSWEATRLLLGLSPTPGGKPPVHMTGQLSSPTRLRLHRIFLIFGLSLASLTWNLPSAILLYWITSSLAYQVYAKAVKYLLPIPKPKVTSCKPQSPIFLMPRRTQDSSGKRTPDS